MITLGIDAHKRTHTVVVVDVVGRQLGSKTTTSATSEDHLALVRWADRFGPERTWAVEDCRHLFRRLEADLLGAGERIVRVPPKLMAGARDSVRTHGKSDPIDALAVARRVRELTSQENQLEREIATLVADLAPHLLALPGVGALGAAEIVAEVADVRRFKSKDAFARHNGTAPLPVWSGNRERHRPSRTGNRQLNAVIHPMAITQARCHEDAAVFLKRREAMGNTPTEARRALKRRLSDVVYRTLLLDAEPTPPTCLEKAA